ncbi:MAG: hypothetical protein OEY79_01055, partial [Anaplasmataceae bacterium]|nr:hypothetical protein [Anaplasmataceae bacterium]
QHTKTLCAIIDEIASFNQEKKGKLKKDLNWFAESSGKFTPRFNELMHRLKMIINNDYLQRTDGIRDIISDLLLKLKREVEEMSQSDCIDRQYILEKIEEVLSYMNAVYHTPIEIVKQNNELIVKLAILIEKIKLDTRSRAEMQDMQSLSHQIHIHNPSQFGTAEDQLKELQASVVGLIESDEIMHNLSSLQSNKTLKVQIRSSTINALQTKISNISDELTKLHETTFHVLEKLNTAFNASNHLKTSDILPKIILLQKLLQEMKRIHHIVENSNFSKISNQELTAEINKLHTLNEINKQYYQKINSQLLHVILLTLDRQSYIMLNSTTNDLRATASNIIEYYQRELICPVHLPGSLNKLSRLFIPFMSPSILSAQG